MVNRLLVVALAVTMSAGLACPPAPPDGDSGIPGLDGGGEADAGPCVNGGACVPEKVCHLGSSWCPLSLCTDTGAFLPAGTPCGAGFVCLPDGECSGRLTLTKVSGDEQHVFPFQWLASQAVVRLTDQTGRAIAGERIDFVPASGMVVTPAFALTDADGQASTTSIRVGLSGFTPLVARGPMNTRASFNVVGDPLPPGTVFDLVGEDRTLGHDGLGKLAPEGHVGEVRGVVSDWSNLNIYFADDCAVRAIGPQGFLSALVGDGTCGDSGDGAAAATAQLNRPTGLAADSGYRRLYIADTGNDRIRVVDLNTGLISTFAGGGTAAGPGWGDLGAARSASLSRPGWIALSPDGRGLLIADTGHDRVRKVDFGTAIITTLLQPSGRCTDPVAFLGCGGELGCGFGEVVLDPTATFKDYSFVVSGSICGTRVGGTAAGVVRVMEGRLDHVAGVVGVTTGGELRNTAYAEPPLIAVEGPHVAIADWAAHRVWSAEATTGLLTRILGDGVPASNGNYVAGATARVARPTGVGLSGKTVYVGDADGHALRAIVESVTAPREIALTPVAGSGERVLQMQPTTQPFQVKAATVTGGLPVSGLSIEWAPPVGSGAACRPDSSSAATDDAGVASVGARVGLTDCTLGAMIRRIHPPLTGPSLSKGATLIPSGQIATFVNERALATEGRSPELGALATLPAPRAVSDGYFVSGCAVRFLSPDGWVSTVAGDPTSCGFGGDDGPGLAARLSNPGDLSVSGNFLYVADTGNNRIRRIYLPTGEITTVAGGGTGTPAADGDGGPATQAVLSRPEHVLYVASSATLYIADNGHNRIRVVDAGTINALVSPTSCNGKVVAFQGCTGPRSCALAQTGVEIHLAATICGSAPGGVTTGIIRLNGSTATHVAGRVGGATTDGTLATQLALQGDLGLSNGADLYFTEGASHRVRKIASVGRAVTTIAGTGTAGFSGDYGPATAARLSAPEGLWVDPGRGVLIADTGNNAIRWVSF